MSEDLSALIGQAWSYSWVRALIVVVASVVLARIVDFVLTRSLRRVTRLTGTDFDDEVVGHLHRPIFITVLLLGLHVASTIVGPPPRVQGWITGLIQTVGILVWTGAGLRLTTTVMDGLGRLSERVAWLDSRTMPLFGNLARLLVVGVASYFLMVTWNINVGAWLASAGILGIAVGFAAKDTIANLFGGLFVIMDAPYKIGDFINLDTGERGRVIKIGLRSTRLMTRDDVEITLPNAVIANAKIVNESGGPSEKTRVAVTVGVAYGSDIDEVRDVLGEAVRSVQYVLPEPEPRIRFTEMGDSALIFRVMVWVDEPIVRGRVIDGLNTEIYKRLNSAGISIPFPQRDVHLIQPPSAAT